jgi:predicted DNA-binding transcriptional regulator AlpA
MTSKEACIFSERLSYWINSGVKGSALYARLSSDPALPPSFSPEAVSEITGLSLAAIKKRRNRRIGPDYIRISHKTIAYPRAAICAWLANQYVSEAA